LKELGLFRCSTLGDKHFSLYGDGMLLKF
jgi:hypothetical protein